MVPQTRTGQWLTKWLSPILAVSVVLVYGFLLIHHEMVAIRNGLTIGLVLICTGWLSSNFKKNHPR